MYEGLGYKTNTKHIVFRENQTALYVDFVFSKGGKKYHLVEREIDLCATSDDLTPEIFDVYYYSIRLNLNISDPKPTEISKAIVNFLGKHKLYLESYTIKGTECFVSYETPKDAKLLYELPHNPFRHQQDIKIKASIQLDDKTDYYKLLDIKIKDPIDTITEKEITNLGYRFKEPGITSFAILSDEDYKKLV